MSGQVSEEVHLGENVPAHCRWIRLRQPLKIPSYQNFSMILSCMHTTAISPVYLNTVTLF